MCERGNFPGGYLQKVQDTETHLKIIGNPRGLDAKQRSFFLLGTGAGGDAGVLVVGGLGGLGDGELS